MANRTALRELQSRLASRLQVARSEGVSVAWLAVEAGQGRYLFPLAHAGEIFPWTPVQPVPYTQAWFLGVANLRGGLYGVVDLARFVTPDAAHRADNTSAETSLLALNTALEVNTALLVDRLAGLRAADAFAAAEPAAANAPAYFGRVMVDAAGARWQEINLQALSQNPFFLSISA